MSGSYCSSSSLYYTNEYISRVILDNHGLLTGGSNYSDYSYMLLASVTRGQTYALSVEGWTRGNYTEYVKVWIDYNQDHDFTDAGEEIDLGSKRFNGTYAFPKNITVPVGATLGNTTMRVSLRYIFAPVPCNGSYGDGETEDYAVKILGTTTTTSTSTTTTTTTTTTSTTPAYCSSASGPNSNEYIKRVMLNTGNKLSNGSTYSDYTSTVYTTLTKGQAYNIYVEGYTLGNYIEYVKAWIDFNQDQDFSDAGEEINIGNYTFLGSHNFSNSFNVPIDAASGNTRMRVSMKYGSAPPYCGNFTYGEVEDYTVTLSAATTTTAPPTTSTTTSTTTSSTTTTVPGEYCSSSTSQYYYEHITNVTLNTGNRPSNGSTYSDYTGSILTTLIAGQTYTFYVGGYTIGLYQESVKAWIDFNQDHDFTDAGEEIDLGSYTFSGTHTFSGSFNVPIDAFSGNTRARVSLKNNIAPTSCEAYTYGEVEDYTIAISETTSTTSTSTSTSTTTTWGSTTTSTSTTTTTTPSYCSQAGVNYYYEYISDVALNTGNQPSGASNYTDYTGMVFTTLARASAYTLYVEVNGSDSATRYVRAWFDFNADKDFTDAGEEIDLGNYTFQGTQTFTVTVTVPQDATIGETRARIAVAYAAYPSLCQDLSYGEVEDYTITISETAPTTTTSTTTSTTGPTTTTVTSTTSTSGGSTTTSTTSGSTTTITSSTTTTSTSASTSTTRPLPTTSSTSTTSTTRPLPTTTSTTSASTTTTTTVVCDLPGDHEPCGTVALSEVVAYINLWSTGQVPLEDVVDLIIVWGSGGTY